MALTNLSQIKGGKQLRTDIDALIESYSAAKVLTDIAKSGEGAGNYNVNELLTEIKNQIASIMGTGESGDGKTSLSTLDTALKGLQDKKVKDVVRMELPVADGKATIPADLTTQVPGIDTTAALPAYTVDNEVLLNENGKPLTVNMATGAFNGKPSVVNETESAKKTDGSLVYKDAENLTAIKVFPAGEWALKDLPADALLDNNEMQLVAYKDALNKVVVELAKDKDLIEAVKKQIGTQAVADQLKAKADVTDVYSVADDGTKTALYRKVADKVKLDDLDKDLQDVIKTAATPDVFDPTNLIAEDAKKLDKDNVVKSDVDTSASGYTASEDKVLSEAAVLKLLKSMAEAVEHVLDKIAVTAEESAPVTEFTLSKVPTDDKVKLYINHQIFIEGEDFTVDRAAKKAMWTFTSANSGFDIDKTLTDAVTFSYDSKKSA